MDKPENYVTRAVHERALGNATPRLPVPRVPSELVAWLEQQFPPRCYEGKERIEDHLRYAGRVELVASMRSTMQEQQLGEVALAALADDVEAHFSEAVTVYSKET